MSCVFVSYRRADAQGWAGRLGSDLASAFGDVARFFDLASIPPGADFHLAIERAIAEAHAVLVLIGPRWLDMRDAQGRRRLDDPCDVVAAEIAQALKGGGPVIPVLLGGASMPAATELTEALQPLRRHNAFELSDVRWDFDRARLFAALEAATPLKRLPCGQVVGDVSVGAGTTLVDASVGNVTGARGVAPTGAVDVLKGATLQRVTIGDITGVDLGPPAGAKP